MKIFILSILIFSTAFSSNTATKMKKCEKIELSRYTALVSCHKIDYIIEYKLEDDQEEDNLKKVTAVSVNDKKQIIMNVSK